MNMIEVDLDLLVLLVDEYLSSLGTASLIDGTKARDGALDIRSFMVKLKDDLECVSI